VDRETVDISTDHYPTTGTTSSEACDGASFRWARSKLEPKRPEPVLNQFDSAELLKGQFGIGV
jgi:hypothetical protein